jgi:hypothetical protein
VDAGVIGQLVDAAKSFDFTKWELSALIILGMFAWRLPAILAFANERAKIKRENELKKIELLNKLNAIKGERSQEYAGGKWLWKR